LLIAAAAVVTPLDNICVVYDGGAAAAAGVDARIDVPSLGDDVVKVIVLRAFALLGLSWHNLHTIDLRVEDDMLENPDGVARSNRIGMSRARLKELAQGAKMRRNVKASKCLGAMQKVQFYDWKRRVGADK
jgi:hypothetical protein